MATDYTEKYYHEYEDIGGNTVRTEIHELEYSGGSTAIDYADGLPNRLRHGGSRASMEEDIVQGQELVFDFWIHRDDIATFDALFESDYKDYLIIQEIGGTEVFRGWLKPENLTKGYLQNPPYIRISLSAADGLADLKTIEFRDTDDSIIFGKVSFLDAIKSALAPIGIDLDLHVQLGTWDKDNMIASDCALDKNGCDARNFIETTSSGSVKMRSCWNVLEHCLKIFNCTLKQYEGVYQITNNHEINSYNFIFDWATLTEQSRSSRNRALDIQLYKFGQIEQQKIRPLKTAELTFHTRDLGGDASGVDLTDWAGVWTHTFGTGVEQFDGSYQLDNAPDVFEDYIELAADFAVVQATDDDYLTMSFDIRWERLIGNLPYPKIQIKMSFDGAYEGRSVLTFQPEEEWQHIELGIIPECRVKASGDYNFRLTFGDAASDGDYPIYLKNFTITKVINPAEGELGTTVTLDRLFKQVHTKNEDKFETEIIVADGLQSTNVGSILFNDATLTELWNSYGYTENIPLADICARNILNNRYRFKNFLKRVVIHDRDNNIGFDTILNFDSRYYLFASHERDFRNCVVIGDLIELLSARQTYASDLQDVLLGTVEGQTAGVIAYSVPPTGTSVNDHNDLNGKQGGTASEYYHFTASEHTELHAWLDDVTLGSGGALTLPGLLTISVVAVPIILHQTGVDSYCRLVHDGATAEFRLDWCPAGDGDFSPAEIGFKSVINAQMEIYYDGDKKLETVSTGIEITGNAGIGRTPTSTLDIYTASGTTVNIEANAGHTILNLDAGGGDYDIRIQFQDDGANKWLQKWDQGTDSMFFYNYALGANVLTMLANGNVGIGTATPDYKLEVSGTGGYSGLIEHPSFTSGFQGTNWQITEDGDAEFRDVLISGGLQVFELIINQLHYQNGGLIIGAGGGKVARVDDATLGSEILFFEDPEGNGIIPFTPGAIVMMQRFDLNSTDVIKKIVRQVSAINSDNSIDFTTTAGWLVGEDTGVFAYGDEIVTIGHVSDAQYSNSLYMSAVDSNNPFLRFYAGVDSYSKWNLGDESAVVTQLGNLESLAGYDIVPVAPGYGLYSDNVYLKGKIVASSGEIGGFTIDATSIYTGTEDHAAYTANSGDMTIYSDGANASIHAYNFYIDNTGKIYAKAGEIGGFTIDATSLKGGSAATTVALVPGTGIYMGAATIGAAPFSVTNAGVLKAESGTIGGWTIANDAIYTGTKKVVDGYSAAGITLDSAGTIHAENFYINSDGSIAARNITLETGTNGNRKVKIGNGELWNPALDLDYADISINRIGYNDGQTKYRDLYIYNGKGVQMVYFDGSADQIQFDSQMWIDKVQRHNTNVFLGGETLTKASVPVNVSGGASAQTIYLPTTPENGMMFHIISGSSGILTIDGNGYNMQDSCGAEVESRVLGSYSRVTVVYVGSKWYMLHVTV